MRSKAVVENPIYNLPENKKYLDMGAERILKEDVEVLMHKMDKEDRQLALACRFEYYCGMRPGKEIRFLKIGDIDFRKGYSRIRISFDRAKSNCRREVAIPDVFLEYLLAEWKLDEYPKRSTLFLAKKNGQESDPWLKTTSGTGL